MITFGEYVSLNKQIKMTQLFINCFVIPLVDRSSMFFSDFRRFCYLKLRNIADTCKSFSYEKWPKYVIESLENRYLRLFFQNVTLACHMVNFRLLLENCYS